MKFRVAIVIASFNRASTLVEAVRSCLDLKLSPDISLNIVVVDDGSTDQSFEELLTDPYFGFERSEIDLSLDHKIARFSNLQRAARSSKGIDVLQIKNSERGAARNFGARWCQFAHQPGWYLFLDSDDVLTEFALFQFFNSYKKIMASADHDVTRSPALLYSWFVNWNGHDSPIRNVKSFPKLPSGDLSLEVLRETRIALGATLISAKNFHEIGGFPERRELSGSEDKILLTRLAFAGNAVFCPQVAVWYRQHTANTNPQKMLRSISLMEMELGSSIRRRFSNSAGGHLRIFHQHCFFKTLGFSIFTQQFVLAAKLLTFQTLQTPIIVFKFQFWRLLVSYLKSVIIYSSNRSLTKFLVRKNEF